MYVEPLIEMRSLVAALNVSTGVLSDLRSVSVPVPRATALLKVRTRLVVGATLVAPLAGEKVLTVGAASVVKL